MCYYLRRIRRRKDRSCPTVDAVYRKRLGGFRFFHSRNQGYGSGNQSAPGIVWKCENIAQQQLIAIWKILRTPVQFCWRTRRSRDHKLLIREVQSCGPDHQRAQFPYLLSIHEGCPPVIPRYVPVKNIYIYIYINQLLIKLNRSIWNSETGCLPIYQPLKVL